MKKRLFKFISAILMVVLLLTAQACRKPDTIIEIENDKTQLYVSNYNGGIGSEWLDKTGQEFEEFYKDTSFETGKKGVQIVVDNDKANKTGSILVANLPGDYNEVFFTEDIYYYDLINKIGRVADITDVVTDKLTDYGETKSIEDKMVDSLISYYKTPENKYYALPFYEAYFGIYYDINLFDENKLWFNKSGTGTGFVNSLTEDRSTGPDGKYGTYDDGLPATYDDFFKMCDRMLEKGITPFTWSGLYQAHTTYMLYQMWADYEGKDQFYLNFSLDGDATSLIESFDGNNSPVISASTTIDNSNGYLLHKQAGKYYSLEFAKRMMSKKSYYSNKCFTPSETHTGAQTTFLTSSINQSPIAMLIDGSWWENEATETFNALAAYGESKYTRNFGIMPFPKATQAKVGEDTTRVSVLNSITFINGNIPDNKLVLAKLFLKFVHTDSMLSLFSQTTSMSKPFEYELTEDQLSNMTTYGKSLYNAHSGENSQIVYPFSNNSVFLNNATKFKMDAWSYKTIINGVYTELPVKEFKDNIDLTAKKYFEGIAPYYQSTWENYQG